MISVKDVWYDGSIKDDALSSVMWRFNQLQTLNAMKFVLDRVIIALTPASFFSADSAAGHHSLASQLYLLSLVSRACLILNDFL